MAVKIEVQGVSADCMEHCPNIKWAEIMSREAQMDPQVVVSALCALISASGCAEPSYTFEEAGVGRRCQAPERTQFDYNSFLTTVVDAQAILAEGPDAAAAAFRAGDAERSAALPDPT